MCNPSVTNKYYTNLGNPEILKRVPQGARIVLDLGCGAGDNARLLSEQGMVVDGVTLSSEEAIIARQFCCSVYVYDLEKGLPDSLAGNYDVIIASHVLEHICFPERLLAGVVAKLSPNGVFLVALPNLFNWRQRIQLLFGNFEYSSSGIMDNTHFRWYTFNSAQRMLERNGFKVIEAYADGAFLLWKLRKVLPRSITTAIDGFASATCPGLFGLQLIYACKRIH
jgi:2-polyprenyl-3-methyl-5-hydroxy-6-metoxy-1,4-benzoquinol methylase